MVLPPLAPDRARRIAAGFGGAHILVVGDAMLDRFIVGRVTRISPEAPVPVVVFDHEMHRIGGAANVAHNITALGGLATLVAVTGQDDAATALAAACHEAGISPSFVGDPSRPTTTKVRIVTERHQQVARIDYEAEAEVAGDLEQRLIVTMMQLASGMSAVVVSDYLKGTVTKRLVRAAIEAAAARGIPVLVDPKIPHVDYYAGATVITPNHHEAESATLMRVRTAEEALDAARAFRTRAGCDTVLMTRGDQGMCLLGRDVEGDLPAAAREVADVTGAGDTVVATMALALSAGATLAEAARLANEAAGISVGKFGPAIVTQAELLAAFGG
ncbi:MAG: D-glycero-beta-D-manno-heptose-7-phosphate kinase [Acidobacteria bacterium]|nr:D-glycero-beta-D-manno-heptose-7-phosphate kinase [Acidobacteriota bacterium]